MSRLVNRVAVRALSVSLLAAGLGGGFYLGVARDHQQRVVSDAANARVEASEMAELKQEIRDYNRATREQRLAEQAARAKAEAAAKAAAAKAAAAEAAARRQQAASRSSTRTTYGPIPSSCSAYSGNQAIGCSLMLQWGYGLDQMPCLVNMWNKESHWNERAVNSSSGAYGIPQALPGDKMAVYGSDWRTNPVPQIKWGLDYIKNRYNSPCGAWSFWQAHGWY
ncbi:MAG TPA: transglycosylase SLT domain-containing protein [Micromonosporaceae bacterium]